MTYPIEAQRVSMEHVGGTKAYYLGIASNADGKSLVTFRWGKIGVFGEVQIHKFDTTKEAERFFEKKLKAKISGGYATKSTKDCTADDWADFRSFFGVPMMTKFQADEIHHIDSSADVSGTKMREDPRLDEDGKLDVETIKRKAAADKLIVDDLKRSIAEKEARDNVEVYSKNPLFGAF